MSRVASQSMSSSSDAPSVTGSVAVITDQHTESKVASSTVRAIGPGVSCVLERGIIPERLIVPTVGLMPTMEFWADGFKMEPVVSVSDCKRGQIQRDCTPAPELDPPTSNGPYGLLPGRPLNSSRSSCDPT